MRYIRLPTPNFRDTKHVTVGVDNGLFGGIVALDEQARVIQWWDTPVLELITGTKKKRKKIVFAPTEMKRIIESIISENSNVIVYLEVAHSKPGEGVTSSFNNGRGAGLWEGIVVGMGLRYDVVHANTWTKKVLKDVPRGETKQRSMIKCQRLFPEIPLTKPRGKVLSRDGRADAALIAYYGWLDQKNIEDPNQLKRKPVKKKVR